MPGLALAFSSQMRKQRSREGRRGRMDDAPKHVHILVLRICERYPIGKRDFTDVVKLRILRWRHYTGFLGCALP